MLENRSITGVGGIAEKSGSSRARISDRRAGVPPDARGHNIRARSSARRIVTMLVVLAVALSLVAPIAATSTATATSSGPPSGMVGVPSSQVGPADNAQGNGPNAEKLPSKIPTDAAAWDVMADKHAGTLSVEIDATSGGDLVVRATDDVNHAGRTIAVDAQTLAQAVGHRPTTAYGHHSSGSTWVESIEYENGYAKIEVSKFSTNEITFDGEVVLSGSPASDGATYQYDLEDASGVDNYSITLEGAEAKEWKNQSGAVSDSVSISAGGTADPIGPGGSPNLTISGDSKTTNPGDSSGDAMIWGDYGGTDLTSKVRVKNADAVNTIDFTSISVETSGSGTVDVAVADDKSGSYTQVKSGWDPTATGQVLSFSDTFYPSGDSFWIRLTSQGYNTDDYAVSYTDDQSSTWFRNSEFGDQNKAVELNSWADINSQTIDDSVSGTSKTVSGISPGESQTVDFPLSNESDSLTFSGDVAGSWDLEMQTVTESVDPSIEINGHTTSYSGTLSKGETASLSTDPSWVQEGTNSVNVSVSESYAATGVVGLDYRHTAPTTQSVDYVAETWSERYNVSKTWSNNRENASVTIPFESSRVIAVREVEMRVNGGSWKSVPDYSLEGTTLTAELGEVSENDTTDVRATGSKVKVDGGDITVLEPTVEGNTLDTALEITNYSDSFGIGVGGTSEGKWLHKTANESWTAPETFVTISANGGQTIRAPGASAGSTMNVRTVPLEVTPDAGKLNLTLKESSKELTFDVEPTSAVSEVTYRYHDTVSGERYILYSETHGVARDSEIAESPVSLLGGSYSETLSIILDSGSGSSSESGGGGFGGAIGGVSSSANPLLVLVIGVAAIAGTAYVSQRTEIPMSVVGGTGLLVAILGIETISPGTISDGVRSAIVLLSSQLGPVMPLIALILVGTGAYMAVRWWQGRTGPDTQVTLQLDGGNK